MTAYYNEFDKRAAEWLRELMKEGLIAPGDVDERSIVDVRADDLAGYGQCHFFAGIGGWSLALRLAGWPDDRPVWTGSCPCQPFSAAGKQRGFADERHLWPEFFRLISERRPATVFGEQVAGAPGRAWIDLVCADLEGAGYAVGAANLCACGVGAPHIRQRLYWCGRLEHSGGDGRARWLSGRPDSGRQNIDRQTGRDRSACGLGYPTGDGLQDGRDGQGRLGKPDGEGRMDGASVRTPWGTIEWLPCRDGRWRPTQPGLFPLADGFPERVGLLRGYGNAIVPQVAETFIRAYMAS